MGASTTERSLAGQVGAYTKWANVVDRTAATAAARETFDRRFEDQVDPERVLPEPERVRRAASARTAYFKSLALKSARARRRSKEADLEAAQAEAQLVSIEQASA